MLQLFFLCCWTLHFIYFFSLAINLAYKEGYINIEMQKKDLRSDYRVICIFSSFNNYFLQCWWTFIKGLIIDTFLSHGFLFWSRSSKPGEEKCGSAQPSRFRPLSMMTFRKSLGCRVTSEVSKFEPLLDLLVDGGG